MIMGERAGVVRFASSVPLPLGPRARLETASSTVLSLDPTSYGVMAITQITERRPLSQQTNDVAVE